jgi:hypothetical protein
LENTEQFLYCDKCGQPILNPADGLIQFITDTETGKCFRFRVIHVETKSSIIGGCEYRWNQLSRGESIGDDSLYCYTGPNLELKLDYLITELDVKNKVEIERLKSRLLACGYKKYRYD